MEHTQTQSEISVVCRDECGPIPRCRAALCDPSGRFLSGGITDECGRAVLFFCRSGVYEVSASAGACRSPHLQSRWARLCGGRDAELCFFFNLPPCSPPAGSGTLRIRLSDAFYPQNVLSEGVYSLWRKF